MSESSALRSAFEHLLPPFAPASAVRLSEWRGGVAALTARRGKSEAVNARFSLSAGSKATARDGVIFVATAPESWLALSESADPRWPGDFALALGDDASVSDLSGAYGVLRVRGAQARDLLQRGVSLDLHPSAFPPGAAAVSLIAHIDVVLWSDPAGDGFYVAVFRSYAESFMHWLVSTAAGGAIALTGAP